MTNVLNILGESRFFDANDVPWTDVSAPVLVSSAAFVAILLIGVALLLYWLATTSCGRTALVDIPTRRNAMAFHISLIPFAAWILLNLISIGIIGRFNKSLDDLGQNLLLLGSIGIIAIVIFIITFIIVRKYFVRGFKGFGLDPRTIGKDLVGAAAKLIAVWPLVLGAIALTLWIGKLLYGQDFELEKHEELELLLKYPQWWVRLTIILFAAVVAPVYEEVLFRGHLQTAFRNLTQRPWVTIIFASGLFALVHANQEHWPALFVLSIGLGYAYEKSGSLFQSIFMHAFFNGTMVAATIIQS